MSDPDLRALQANLLKLGHSPGPLDGQWGPKTDGAMVRCRQSRGRAGRSVAASEPLWVTRCREVMGLHEVRDNAKLSAFLKLDGRTLGDPARLPWCGDLVETCIRLALPEEPLPGVVGRNPYWARNWAMFGVHVPPTFGAVASFMRESGGHVGFLVGIDAAAFHVLGGNQGNEVNVTRIAQSRLLATRWPSTVPLPRIGLPIGQSDRPLSLNEA